MNLIVNMPRPLDAGTSATWTAMAKDSDGDQILYKFRLKGPATGGDWRTVSYWGTKNAWTWDITLADAGSNQVQVQIRDGKHAGPDDSDDYRTESFTINAPAPQPTPEPVPETVMQPTTRTTEPVSQTAPQTISQPEIPPLPSVTQPEQQSQQIQSTPAPVVNRPPVLNGLTASPSSPQDAGTTVTWMADASDLDGDQIFYQFVLRGPATQGQAKEVTDWTQSNTWTWTTDSTDMGQNQVEVRVRDGHHAGPTTYDADKVASFVVQPQVLSAQAPVQDQTPVTVTEANPGAQTTVPGINLAVPTTTMPAVTAPTVTLSMVTAPEAPTPQPSGTSAETPQTTTTATIPSPVSNIPPTISSLTPDKTSPQTAGTNVSWTATAADPDGDRIFYQFLLSGPSTSGRQTDKTGWITSNGWTWDTTQDDVGISRIEVRISDGEHTGSDSYDDNQVSSYTISPAPVSASVVTSSQPTIAQTINVPNVTTPTINATTPTIAPVINISTPTIAPSLTPIIPNATNFTAPIINVTRSVNVTAPIVPVIIPLSAANVTAPVLPGPANVTAPTVNAITPASPLITLPSAPNLTVPSAVPANVTAPIMAPMVAPVTNATVPGANVTTSAPPPGNLTGPAIPAINISVPIAPVANVTVPAVNATTPVIPAANVTQPPSALDETVIPAANVTAPTVNVTVPANITTSINATAPEATPPAPTETINQPPVVSSLTPDKSSPQLAGTAVAWSSNATDPDNNDMVLYRFFLNGPSTGNAWQPKTDWTQTSTWTWTTTSADVGANQIRVGVIDGKHARPEAYDSEQLALYTITQQTMNISGAKFRDVNGNGVKDSGDTGLSGWTISLTKPGGTEVSTLTGADGFYRFSGLASGTYSINEVVQTGWSQTLPISGPYSVNLADSDITGRDFGNRLTSYSISGRKFNDLNGNGINDGEPGLDGWTIRLSGADVQNITTTAADGSYSFAGLAPGTYTISEEAQAGWTQTAPANRTYSVMVTNADLTGRDFGSHGTYAITGTKFNDANGNGARDGGEVALPGWSIQLLLDGSVINATSTVQDGSYAFRDLSPGTYTVSEVAQDGWAATMPTGGSYQVTLINADVTGRDFGNSANLSVTGLKYYDINGNGVQDSDEPGITGSTVTLEERGRTVDTTTTKLDGSYAFNNLDPGNYTVTDPAPDGLVLTTPTTVVVSVTTRVTMVKVSFGLWGQNIITGNKFNDLNGNGARDQGESGIAGWGMALHGVTFFGKDITIQTVTGADGSYSFNHLVPGTYTVSELSRTGWTQTAPASSTYSVPFSRTDPPMTVSGRDFGNRIPTPVGLASIAGSKYSDLNANGARDPGEPGLSGWIIHVTNATRTMTVVTGPDGGYIFNSLSPGTYMVSEVLQPRWRQTAPSTGTYSITLAAGQSYVGADFGNYNDLPRILSFTAVPPGPRPSGAFATWTTRAEDGEGDTLLYKYFVRGLGPYGRAGQIQDWSASPVFVWNTAGLPSGTYQVEVWVRDQMHVEPGSYDARTVATYNLVTPVNLPPTIDFIYSNLPAIQFGGSWIGWTTRATDPDGDGVFYRYYLRGPSTGGFWADQTGWTPNPTWVWRTTPLDAGPSEVMVLVTDNRHLPPYDYAIADYLIINPNQSPTITGFGSNVPSPQPVGASTTWRANAFDPEGNQVFYRYAINGPSTGGLWKIVREWSTDPNWSWFTSPADLGMTLINVQIRDGYHTSPTGWDDDALASFTVLKSNRPPAMKALTPDKPNPQYAGTPLRWTAVASNPEPEPLLYRFWLKGPSTGNAWKVVQDWSTNNAWNWATGRTDTGVYTVYVYVRDGFHTGPAGFDSALGGTFTLLEPNRPPVMQSLTPSKQSPQYAGDPITWSAIASDPDGDPLLYRFWLKGPSTSNAWKIAQDWSSSNVWTWATAPADVGGYTVYAYVRDGKHAGPNAYDSALGSTYSIQDPLAPRKLTAGRAVKAMPFLVTTGAGYLMVYQSMENGPGNKGDIASKVLGSSWNTLAAFWIAADPAYQGSPSSAFDSGRCYVAYTSSETGSRNIFVNTYNSTLHLVERRQLTSGTMDQDSPAILKVGNGFLLAYRTWDTGPRNGGDIYLTAFDQNWRALATVPATDQSSYQDHPSLTFAGDSFYLAYATNETGNWDIFVKRFDGNLNFLETRRITTDRADQDYPCVRFNNDHFCLTYSTRAGGSYNVVLGMFDSNWKAVDNTAVTTGVGDKIGPSLVYDAAGKLYWVAYSAQDAEGQNIYVKPLKLSL